VKTGGRRHNVPAAGLFRIHQARSNAGSIPAPRRGIATGKFTGFHASVTVSCVGAICALDRSYSFSDEGDED